MATEITCSTSKEPVTNNIGTVQFKCPNCGQSDIVRSRQMRAIASKFTCPSCGFVGPHI